MAKIDFAARLEMEREDRRVLRYLGEAGYLCLARLEIDQAERIFDGLTHLVPGDPVVLQVERSGQLLYVTLTVE